LLKKQQQMLQHKKSSDKDILPAAKSLWGIAKDFGENLKS